MSEESGTKERDRGSWASCLGCLLGGLIVIGALVSVLVYFYQRSEAVDARIEEAIVRPWADAVREDDVARVWSTLTTEAYRARSPGEDVARTYRAMVERWGPPREVSVIDANGVYESTTGRSYKLTRTSWIFERGATLLLTFEIVEPGEGVYRVDLVRPGGDGRLLPRDLPEGPL